MMINEFSGEYRWLSNFWPVGVVKDGIAFPSVEHAFQAMKTTDLVDRVRIAACSTPGKAKRLGRTVDLRPDWEEIKLVVMKECLDIKFYNRTLRDRLVATGNEELVEGNGWNDTFWGVCRGVGENHLGRLLMEVRRELI